MFVSARLGFVQGTQGTYRTRDGGETWEHVVAECDDGSVVLLLGPGELEACAASPERLVAAIEQALTSSTPSPA
jgi:photosystem II stability/assembly factor-like uncharacterized protein